jgi:hypothetical protein
MLVTLDELAGLFLNLSRYSGGTDKEFWLEAWNYRRLSRYDETGLIWLLRGRPVIALTETIAAIQGATAVLTYRKLNKPSLGPLGDSLDDMGAAR